MQLCFYEMAKYLILVQILETELKEEGGAVVAGIENGWMELREAWIFTMAQTKPAVDCWFS